MSRHQFTNIQLPLSLLFVHILLSNASCVCEYCIPFQYKFATVLCLFTSFFLRPFHPFGLCSTLLYCAIFSFYLYPVQLNWRVRECVCYVITVKVKAIKYFCYIFIIERIHFCFGITFGFHVAAAAAVPHWFSFSTLLLIHSIFIRILNQINCVFSPVLYS